MELIFSLLFVFFVLAPICTTIWLFGKDAFRMAKKEWDSIKDKIFF